MKRTLLLLTALALVPGCYSSSHCGEPGTITFYWRFVSASNVPSGNLQPDDPATPNVDESGCTFLGVPLTDDDPRSDVVTPSIRITIDNTQETVGCVGTNGVPGVRLPGFLRGTHSWQIDALRGGRVVFTASGTTDARTCGDTSVDVDLRPVTPTDLVVLYDVNQQPPANCKVGGVPIANVPWELRNTQNQIVDSSCLSRDPGTSACTTEGLNACDPASLGFTIPSVAIGSYTMNYVELWDVNTPNTHVPLAEICGARVVHDGFPVLLNLTAPTNGFCPTTPATPLAASTPAAP